ncbi:unnamed protein product [Prunus armeniaca]|uniref:Uncharacterized protein n=1 Tax=Prunus armeniaca TaxID=36596 RepID=A0A6J5TNX6_PRUAR|nr:unnamed protein product [Prunus armeniaca]
MASEFSEMLMVGCSCWRGLGLLDLRARGGSRAWVAAGSEGGVELGFVRKEERAAVVVIVVMATVKG